VFPRPLEHTDRAEDVHVRVAGGIGYRRAHPGLRGQVDQRIGRNPLSPPDEGGGVADVPLEKGERRVRRNLCQVSLLDPPVVERIEVVESVDPVSAGEERFCYVGTDEAGSAGDECVQGHAKTSRIGSPRRFSSNTIPEPQSS
jgi:hypothetical protein